MPQPHAVSLPRLRRWRESRRLISFPGRKKPSNLIYDVDDIPPRAVQIAAAFQHVFVMAVGWIYVVMVVNAVGGTTAEMQSLIRMSMVGIGHRHHRAIKTGLGKWISVPAHLQPYLPCSPSHGWARGRLFAYVRDGMVAGVAAMLVSRVVHRLRILFPPEVTGLMVAMSGLQLVALGCPRILGYSKSNSVANPRALLVGVITLFAMIIPTIWKLGKLHLFPMLLGMGAGYAAAFGLGELRWGQLIAQMPSTLIRLPTRAASGLSFSLLLLPPFLIAALTATLKTVGDTTLCQKLNDADWKRSDMRSVSGGVLANGIGNAVSGLLGGIAQNTTSSSIGLSLATGTTSRAIALPLGLLAISLAFFPRLAMLVAAMPSPAVGAVLIYSACFIVLGGLQLLTSRMLDARRIFAVGISLILASASK